MCVRESNQSHQCSQRVHRLAPSSLILLTLPIFGTKSNDDDVGVLDHGFGPQVVQIGPELVPIAPLFFHPQNYGPAVIAVFVAGVGRGEGDGQLLLGNAFGYHFPPIAVNFATQIHLPDLLLGSSDGSREKCSTCAGSGATDQATC